MERSSGTSYDRTVEHKRRQRRIFDRARWSHAGVATYMTLSGLALRLSISGERDPQVRKARQRILLRHWRQIGNDILGTPVPPRLY